MELVYFILGSLVGAGVGISIYVANVRYWRAIADRLSGHDRSVDADKFFSKDTRDKFATGFVICLVIVVFACAFSGIAWVLSNSEQKMINSGYVWIPQQSQKPGIWVRPNELPSVLNDR